MTFETFKFTVADHFLPAIINGDMTGLDDAEEFALDQFMDRVHEMAPENFTFGHFAIDFEDCPPDYAVCEICDQLAMTQPLTVVYVHKFA